MTRQSVLGYPVTVSVFPSNRNAHLPGQYAYVEFRSEAEAEKALALANVSLAGQQLRVSKARPFAKLLVDPTYVSDVYKTLEQSVQTNVKFKDIDSKRALEILGSEVTIQPPSTVLVLKDLLTMEEVSSPADDR